ncbi:MAG: hypothetical protein IJM83_05160 [Firmicutes bacterium]|nr:hypothetical protein [Bacillota bacterium]
MQDMSRKTFVSTEGIALGSAVLPEGYITSGTIVQKWQCDAVPMTISMAAVSPGAQIIIASSSREMFEDYQNPTVRQSIQNLPTTIPGSLRTFTEPYVYLMQFASAFAQTQLTPVATATLPSAYGKDPGKAVGWLKQFFMSHSVNITVRIEIANATCQGILVKYRGQKNGKNIVVLAGMDYQGIEYYDANNTFQQINMMMNPLGALGSLFGGMGKSQPQQARQMQPLPPNGQIPFGHASQYGKQVDCIQWGCNRSYIATIPEEREEEGTNAFLNFVSSLVPDEALQQQYDSFVEQMFRQRTLEAQGYAAQAQQAQINLMQSQRNLQQTLARNSAEMSAMTMDSWNKKMASDSRISAARSEAIRGVNTYTGLDGRPVEVSVVADHVYQNQYGDTFGVSGNALDQDLLNQINWTKIG